MYFLASRVPRAKDCADCGLEDWRHRTPSRPAFVGRFGISTKRLRRAHASRASGANFEAVPGPAQFQPR
eukprot:14206035-Alexandrium_andersonii.AAC.1